MIDVLFAKMLNNQCSIYNVQYSRLNLLKKNSQKSIFKGYNRMIINGLLEQHSVTNKINISEATHRIVKDRYQFESRGKIEAKNIGAIEMYFLK
jgi:hypothetical protein